jgi:HEPN domain-containing protein
MTEPAKEWLKKSDADYASMRREYRPLFNPNYDSACFHAQQCIEKLLKAYLIEQKVHFPKTHDLRALIKLTYLFHPEWKLLEEDAASLSEDAVDTRYPGEDRTREDAQDSIAICKKIRNIVRRAVLDSNQLQL